MPKKVLALLVRDEIQAHYKRKWFYLWLYSGKGWLKKLMEMEAPSDGLLIESKQLMETVFSIHHPFYLEVRVCHSHA